MRILILVLALSCCAATAHAQYTVDGNVSDWGVDLSVPAAQTKNYLDNNPPSGSPSIDYVTDDTADTTTGNSFYVGPGYTKANLYDAEALFFDNDKFNAYLAVITGTPQSGADFAPGDIFFDLGKYQNPFSAFYDPNKYEFAVDIGSSNLYAVGSWQQVAYAQHSASNPYKIGPTGNTLLGPVDFVYGPEINSHYVLEASIPLALLNIDLVNNPAAMDIWLHWTMECGNDEIHLKGDINPVPEPATLSLLSLGLLGGIPFCRKRKKAANGRPV